MREREPFSFFRGRKTLKAFAIAFLPVARVGTHAVDAGGCLFDCLIVGKKEGLEVARGKRKEVKKKESEFFFFLYPSNLKEKRKEKRTTRRRTRVDREGAVAQGKGEGKAGACDERGVEGEKRKKVRARTFLSLPLSLSFKKNKQKNSLVKLAGILVDGMYCAGAQYSAR